VLAVLDRRRCHNATARLRSSRGRDPFPVHSTRRSSAHAFAHESGSTRRLLKNSQTYEIMMPESVGSEADLAGHGNTPGVMPSCTTRRDGLTCRANQLEDAFVRFKALADRKKHIYDETSRRWSTRRSRMRRTYQACALSVIAERAGRSAPR